MKYVVYTRQFREQDGPDGAVVEVVVRSDRKTADADAKLLADIARRAVWVEEQEGR